MCIVWYLPVRMRETNKKKKEKGERSAVANSQHCPSAQIIGRIFNAARKSVKKSLQSRTIQPGRSTDVSHAVLLALILFCALQIPHGHLYYYWFIFFYYLIAESVWLVWHFCFFLLHSFFLKPWIFGYIITFNSHEQHWRILFFLILSFLFSSLGLYLRIGSPTPMRCHP